MNKNYPEKIEAGPFVLERSTDGTYLLCAPSRDSFTWEELVQLAEEINLSNWVHNKGESDIMNR